MGVVLLKRNLVKSYILYSRVHMGEVLLKRNLVKKMSLETVLNKKFISIFIFTKRKLLKY